MKFTNISNSSIDIMVEPYARLYTVKPGITVDIIDVAGNAFADIEIQYDDDGMETLSMAAQADNLDSGDAPRDWQGFFKALADFIERVLPLILKLFGMG